MPLDPMFSEPMVKPFRDMVADVDGRGLAGPDVDAMHALLGEMEQLARECHDIGTYSGQLAQRGTFQKFSDAYGRALATAARQATKGDDDESLFANTLRAYEQALQTYRSGQGGPAGTLLIPVVERIVALGRSGVSYPVFLRRLEEEGLARALSGAAPATRAGIEQELHFARTAWHRYDSERLEKLLGRFDQMVAAAPFGQPDPMELSLARRRLEWSYVPLEARWQAEVDRWQRLLDLVNDWVDSFASFAPYDTRWRTPGASEATVRENIERTRECNPGDFRYHEQVFARSFGLSWDQLFGSESFTWEYTANRVELSDERLHLIREAYPTCAPGGQPPPALVQRAEALHPAGDSRPGRGQPPPWGTPLVSFPAQR
jgi:hypothetical protein